MPHYIYDDTIYLSCVAGPTYVLSRKAANCLSKTAIVKKHNVMHTTEIHAHRLWILKINDFLTNDSKFDPYLHMEDVYLGIFLKHNCLSIEMISNNHIITQNMRPADFW